MPRDIGAQLVKSLTFAVEAIPQDEANVFKKSENVTPFNVKVRVRKKEDNSLIRKGMIIIPSTDHPNGKTERLRLASSDQTIMSFKITLEADLEKKVAKKSKRSFFGICLGNRRNEEEDEDEAQYKRSRSDLDISTESDSGVVKLRHVSPDNGDVTTPNSSRTKDKFFGKCKPGGCLDPPFGEDRYAYHPKPLRYNRPATGIIDAQNVDLQERSSYTTPDKVAQKKKQGVSASATSAKDVDEKDQDLPVLNLYQGEPGAAIKEVDSALLITYPPTLSSSGMLADEKNEVRKTSGARQSRKSFNEFNTEYFSPPRTSKDSRESSRSERGKSFLTKEILAPGKAASISPTRFRQPIENETKSNSIVKEEMYESDKISSTGATPRTLSSSGILADEKNEDNFPQDSSRSERGKHFSTKEILAPDKAHSLSPTRPSKVKEEVGESGKVESTNISFLPNDEPLSQKAFLRTTSQEMIFELENSIKNDLDRDSWGKSAAIAEIAGLRVATTGVGVAVGTTKSANKLEELKLTFQVNDESRDHTQLSNLGSEYIEKNNISEMETIAEKNVINQKYEGEINAVVPPNTNVGILSPETATMSTLERDFSPIESTVSQGTQRSFKPKTRSKHDNYGDLKTRPIHDETYGDLSARGNFTEGDLDVGNLGSPWTDNTDGDFVSETTDAMRDFERDLLILKRPMDEDIIGNLTSITRIEDTRSDSQQIERNSETTSYYKGTQEHGSSKRATPPVEKAKSDTIELDSESGGKVKKGGSDRSFSFDEINKGTEPREMTATEDFEQDLMMTGPPINNHINENLNREIAVSSRSGSLRQGRSSTVGIAGNISLESTYPQNRNTEEEYDENYDYNYIMTTSDGDVIVNEVPLVGIDSGTEPKEIVSSLSIKQEHPSWENIYKSDPTEKDDLLWSKPMTESTEADNITSLANASMSTNRMNDDNGEVTSKMRDATEKSDVFTKSPDIMLQYQKKLNEILGPLDTELPNYTSHQVKNKSSDKVNSPEGQYGLSIQTTPTQKPDSYREDLYSVNKYKQAQNHLNDTDMIDGGRSEESVFLNLAFLTYLDENQTAIRTLDSSQNHDPNNVVLIKSLLRPKDKGISVPVDVKHIMNITITPASSVQRIPRKGKPISKFDSGKSDSSSSQATVKNTINDTHEVLSKVFHQELVPLRTIIKSLKDDIDSLACQQIKLRERLEHGSKKPRIALTKKCGCLKRTASSRTEP